MPVTIAASGSVATCCNERNAAVQRPSPARPLGENAASNRAKRAAGAERCRPEAVAEHALAGLKHRTNRRDNARNDRGFARPE